MKSAPLVAAGTAVLALAACDHGPSAIAPSTSPISLTIVSGNSQSAPVNTLLPQPVRVRVLNGSGQPVPNFVVDFVVTSGGGSVFGGAEVTNPSGYADELWTLGPRLGAQTLTARSVNPSTGAAVTYGTFTATPTPPANVSVVGTNAVGIFMMNANGSAFQQLTTNAADVMPGLSPDHHQITFMSGLLTGQAVYLMNVDGTNRHVISLSSMCGGTGDPPHFSPDGSLILYTAVFANPDCGPSHTWGVQIADTLGNVVGGFLQDGTVTGASSWSADGQHFDFGSSELDDGENLYESFPVPTAPDRFAGIGWATSSELTHTMVVALSAASPDGHHIAFVATLLASPRSPSYVYVMDTDGSNMIRLTTAIGLGGVLSWSPDGTLIAIDHGFMNADGTGYTVVKGCPCQFAWK